MCDDESVLHGQGVLCWVGCCFRQIYPKCKEDHTVDFKAKKSHGAEESCRIRRCTVGAPSMYTLGKSPKETRKIDATKSSFWPEQMTKRGGEEAPLTPYLLQKLFISCLARNRQKLLP